MLPSYWPLFEAYHRVREPLYRQIITETLQPLGASLRVLDVGCGDAFYSNLLAEVLDAQAQVVAFDNQADFLRARVRHARVEPCLGIVERACFAPGTFDAIWLCRALHDAPDPAVWFAALRPLLKPNGCLVVIENDFEHSPLVGWPVDFGQRLSQANHRFHHSRSQTMRLERYYAARYLRQWLHQTNFTQITLRTHLSEEAAPMAADLEDYWRQLLQWHGRRVWDFLSPEDQVTYTHAFDPNSPDYFLGRPGFYCAELTTVAVGKVN